MITYRLSLTLAVLLLVTGCARERTTDAPTPADTTPETEVQRLTWSFYVD